MGSRRGFTRTDPPNKNDVFGNRVLFEIHQNEYFFNGTGNVHLGLAVCARVTRVRVSFPYACHFRAANPCVRHFYVRVENFTPTRPGHTATCCASLVYTSVTRWHLPPIRLLWTAVLCVIMEICLKVPNMWHNNKEIIMSNQKPEINDVPPGT